MQVTDFVGSSSHPRNENLGVYPLGESYDPSGYTPHLIGDRTMKTDPRDSKAYRDLLSAHSLLERVVIALESDGPFRRLMAREAADTGVSVLSIFAREIKRSMDRIGPHIPCKYEGIPSWECDCPDCCGDD